MLLKDGASETNIFSVDRKLFTHVPKLRSTKHKQPHEKLSTCSCMQPNSLKLDYRAKVESISAAWDNVFQPDTALPLIDPAVAFLPLFVGVATVLLIWKLLCHGSQSYRMRRASLIAIGDLDGDAT